MDAEGSSLGHTGTSRLWSGSQDSVFVSLLESDVTTTLMISCYVSCSGSVSVDFIGTSCYILKFCSCKISPPSLNHLHRPERVHRCAITLCTYVVNVSLCPEPVSLAAVTLGPTPSCIVTSQCCRSSVFVSKSFSVSFMVVIFCFLNVLFYCLLLF